MAFIPVPDVAQLNLGYITDTGDLWSNGFHFLRASGWATASLQTLCEAVEDAWVELLAPLVGTNGNLQKVSARDLTSASGAYYEINYATPLPGTRSAAAVALHTSMSVTFRTANRGRSYRGRIYHYGLGNTDRQDEKSWQSGVAVTVSNAYDGLRDILNAAAGADMVVASRYSGNASRITGIATEITNIVARLPIATQRRRLIQ